MPYGCQAPPEKFSVLAWPAPKERNLDDCSGGGGNGCPCSLFTVAAPNGRLGNDDEPPKVGKLELRDGGNDGAAIGGV
jgi:hypothetical protein